MKIPIEDGSEGIQKVGPREYVGGLWEQIGRLQFEMMVQQGLKPSHVLLDIACGSLRGGIHFIEYLEPGHYLGIDKEAELIRHGVENELTPELRSKDPEFHVSDLFEFRFSKRPDYSIAQSLFSHLTVEDISLCLRNLHAFAPEGHVLCATFNEGPPHENPPESHSWGRFDYPREQMEELGRSAGWEPVYVGDWGHPRGQKLMRFEKPVR